MIVINSRHPIDSLTLTVARIAYLASDVILSVQPALKSESEFSLHLNRFAANKAKNVVSQTTPEIISARHNADPLLSAYSALKSGKLVAATAPSSILLNSVPHLYKLAQYPVVLHVALGATNPDFSEISSVRQSGFTFLQSETLQETQDIALTAHALAIKSGRGVLHFYDPSNSRYDTPIQIENRDLVQSVLETALGSRASHSDSAEDTLYAGNGRTATTTSLGSPTVLSGQTPSGDAQELLSPHVASSSTNGTTTDVSSVISSRRDSSADSTTPSSLATTVDVPVSRPVSATDIYHYATEIWSAIQRATGRSYNAIEYSGPPDAEAALFIFGSTGVFVDVLDADDVPVELTNVGLITARLYRPWLGSSVLLDSIPSTIKRIAVLEQIRRKTTKWGPHFSIYYQV